MSSVANLVKPLPLSLLLTITPPFLEMLALEAENSAKRSSPVLLSRKNAVSNPVLQVVIVIAHLLAMTCEI
jgi:hypothetical protein